MHSTFSAGKSCYREGAYSGKPM